MFPSTTREHWRIFGIKSSDLFSRDSICWHGRRRSKIRNCPRCTQRSARPSARIAQLKPWRWSGLPTGPSTFHRRCRADVCKRLHRLLLVAFLAAALAQLQFGIFEETREFVPQGKRVVAGPGQDAAGQCRGARRLVMLLDQPGGIISPLSRLAIVVSRPRAMTCSVIIPASHLPRSISDRCPQFISRSTSRSSACSPCSFVIV
jgi:hypothetical protein